MIAFVIGNGRSREGISLDDMAEHGKVFGCNAIYRDFTPYVLVSVDKGITMEISKNKVPDRITHYARHPQHPKSIKLDPTKHHSRSASGPVATKLAALESGIKKVYLVGVDLNSPDSKVNNIYAGTSNYRAASGPAVKWHKWEKQYLEVFKQHPEIQFYRVMPMTRYVPSIWKGIKNIHHIEKEEFAKQFGFELGKVSYTATPAPNPPEERTPKHTPRPTPSRPVRPVQEKNKDSKYVEPNIVLSENFVASNKSSTISKVTLRSDSKYFVLEFTEDNVVVSSQFMMKTKFKGKSEQAKSWAEDMNKKLSLAKNNQDRTPLYSEIINVIEQRR